MIQSHGRSIPLSQLLPEIPAAVAEVTACTYRLEQVREGTAFFVFPEHGQNCRTVSERALQKGAVAIIAESGALLPEGGPYFKVKDVRAAYARACYRMVGCPDRFLPITAILGDAGKTTIAWSAARILAEGGFLAGVISTLGYFDGEDVCLYPYTTPPPDLLATKLEQMLSNDCNQALLEVSPGALTERVLEGLRFDCLCFARLHSLTKTGRTNRDLGRGLRRVLRRLKPDGVLVVNADDPGWVNIARRVDTPLVTYGLRHPAHVRARVLDKGGYGQTVLLQIGRESVPVRLRLVGTHQLYSVLAAASLAVCYGVPPVKIAKGLSAFNPLPSRLEPVRCGQPFSVFVDVADSAERLATVLNSLRSVVSGRLMCITVGSSSDQIEQLRPTVEKLADTAVFAASCMEHFSATSVTGQIRNWEEALLECAESAEPGDCILVTGPAVAAVARRKPNVVRIAVAQLLQQRRFAQQYAAGSLN